MKFGRVEKIVLLYFGFKRNESSKLLKRTEITRDIKKLLGKEDDTSFPVVLNNSIKKLILDKKLLYRRYSRIGINKKGLKYAVQILEELKNKGTIKNWDDILSKL